MTQVTEPRAMRADARRNREKLLTAARSVFAERGSEASIEEIAKLADVGVGTLYRNFPKRIDLVEAVYREDVEALVARGEQLVAQEAPWAALEGWLEAFVRYAQAKRAFLTELHEAFEKNPDLAVALRQKIVDTTSLVLTSAQRDGSARPDIDATDLMQLIGGMCMSRPTTLAQNERLLVFVLDGIRTQR